MLRFDRLSVIQVSIVLLLFGSCSPVFARGIEPALQDTDIQALMALKQGIESEKSDYYSVSEAQEQQFSADPNLLSCWDETGEAGDAFQQMMTEIAELSFVSINMTNKKDEKTANKILDNALDRSLNVSAIFKKQTAEVAKNCARIDFFVKHVHQLDGLINQLVASMEVMKTEIAPTIE